MNHAASLIMLGAKNLSSQKPYLLYVLHLNLHCAVIKFCDLVLDF